MKTRVPVLLFVSFTTFALMSSCVGSRQTSFPDTEIVYQTGPTDHPWIGFVDSDGMNKSFIRSRVYLIKPIWSLDGDTLYILARFQSVVDGFPSIWEKGERLRSCKQWFVTDVIGGVIKTDDITKALILDSNQILLIDLKKCVELKKIVDYMNTGTYLFGLSLSPDNERFAYGIVKDYYDETKKREASIIIQDMNGGEPVLIGSGINPAWSPDGHQISYLQMDGIYVMDSNGSNSRRVVELDVSNGENDGEYHVLAPYPRWSPDGKWLIFHRCHPECSHIDDFKIVKVEISTGKEEIVTNEGAYPYWR